MKVNKILEDTKKLLQHTKDLLEKGERVVLKDGVEVFRGNQEGAEKYVKDNGGEILIDCSTCQGLPR